MDPSLNNLILKMKDLGDELDKIKAIQAEVQKEYDKLRLFDIPNAMAEQDVRSITGGFGRCTLTADLHVSVKDGQKMNLHGWLNETGNGSLIVPTVNAQTLKAFVKEQMQSVEGATALPEHILKIAPFSRAVIYKN